MKNEGAMKSLIYLSSLCSLIALFVVVAAAQQGSDDRVYTAGEVDVKAKITNKFENVPENGSDCPRQGMVRLQITLHKSGRVTEVTIMKGMNCSYDKATVEIARKFKFTPVKDGQQVSQYQIFEYRYGDQ